MNLTRDEIDIHFGDILESMAEKVKEERDTEKRYLYNEYYKALIHTLRDSDKRLYINYSLMCEDYRTKDLVPVSIEVYERLADKWICKEVLDNLDTLREVALSFGQPHRPRKWSPDEYAEKSKERGKKRREKLIYGQ